MATKTISKSNDFYEITNSSDAIIITAKKNATVYGNSGKNTITVTKGTGHMVYGYDGKDTITAKKGGGFDVLSRMKGNDKITVQNGAKP